MSEQEVFWLGRKPAAVAETGSPADDAALRGAVTAACEAAGCPAGRFVAALGPFGSWLLELRIGEVEHRAIWNGKERRLSLDRIRPTGGWDELRAVTPDEVGPESFGAALAALLAGQPEAGAG